MLDQVTNFYMTYAEHLITVILALCVFMAARGKIINWPIGLVGVTMYGLHAWFVWGLYADALLQIFYFATGVFGWVWWCKGGANRTQAPVTDCTWLEKGLLLTVIGFVTFHWGQYLVTNTDSTVPYMDAFTTVTCLIAQLLLMFRNRFTWILWIIADVVYVYLFYVKGLNLLSIEYALFTLNAVFGYYMWTKQKVAQ